MAGALVAEVVLCVFGFKTTAKKISLAVRRESKPPRVCRYGAVKLPADFGSLVAAVGCY
jgi:hypothetical protein